MAYICIYVSCEKKRNVRISWIEIVVGGNTFPIIMTGKMIINPILIIICCAYIYIQFHFLIRIFCYKNRENPEKKNQKELRNVSLE